LNEVPLFGINWARETKKDGSRKGAKGLPAAKIAAENFEVKGILGNG